MIPDFKGLKGDPSDNIIGVKGIGEKTAARLIKYYGNLDELYRRLKSTEKRPTWLKERVLKLLLDNEEEAFFSRELGLIRRDAPVSPRLEELSFAGVPYEAASRVFRKFHFPSLLARLEVPKSEEKASGARSLTEESVRDLGKAKTLGLFFENDKLFIGTDRELWAVDTVPKNFSEIFDDGQDIIVHDGKRVYHFASRIFKISFDTKIAAWLLDPERKDFSLADLLGEETSEKVSSPPIGLFLLAKKYRERLSEEKLEKIYFDFELPLVPILAEMESTG
ncbi:MAG: hypothetical protein HYT34_02605, partial [Candidatus Ryanbacteria bacterium]|nr:hypothetical protein [Candidatus Ryanbacteria bacterium]